MQYSSVNRLGDFEFHDAELSLLSWENDRLTVSAKYLNVHKNAAPGNEGTDMEISEAIITFYGFDLKEFEPARTWKRDKHGNVYTNDPLIIHTGAVAKSMLMAELQHTAVVMGMTYVDGIYDLGALGIDPYFSARFTFLNVIIEWDSYRKKAWYERKR